MYVQVLDENDNNPYFVTDINNLNVMENSKIGTEIATIQARDPDSGDYGKITYLLDRMSSEVSPNYLFNIYHEMKSKKRIHHRRCLSTGYVCHPS